MFKIKDFSILKNKSLRFVILLGLVSLFADMTYESARSITGPYLAILGANAAMIGFISGLGELMGYGLRFFSGYLADRTKKYWTFVIVGYACNLLAVPLLALTRHWWTAAILIILERSGRAIRTPPRDAMLSYAGEEIKMGWAFGLHEAIDQIGAMIGPLLLAFILYKNGSYQACFAVLLIPALCSLTLLFIAKIAYPSTQALTLQTDKLQPKWLNKPFWLYLTGASLIAAGYADFPLIAYHFLKIHLISSPWIPIWYAIAMGVNSVSAPILGKLYDKQGFIVLIIVSMISSFFAPLVFLGTPAEALLGVILWSIGMGAQESLMRSIVATMAPKTRRSSAYGIFNTGYGISWFIGSAVMGILYGISISTVVWFSLASQLLAIPILWKVLVNKSSS